MIPPDTTCCLTYLLQVYSISYRFNYAIRCSAIPTLYIHTLYYPTYWHLLDMTFSATNPVTVANHFSTIPRLFLFTLLISVHRRQFPLPLSCAFHRHVPFNIVLSFCAPPVAPSLPKEIKLPIPRSLWTEALLYSGRGNSRRSP